MLSTSSVYLSTYLSNAHPVGKYSYTDDHKYHVQPARNDRKLKDWQCPMYPAPSRVIMPYSIPRSLGDLSKVLGVWGFAYLVAQGI